MAPPLCLTSEYLMEGLARLNRALLALGRRSAHELKASEEAGAIRGAVLATADVGGDVETRRDPVHAHLRPAHASL